jgi:putative protease
VADPGAAPLLIADFSLNVTNTLSALEILKLCPGVFTPSYDMDATQLKALVDSPLGPYAEVVVHHPMPLFHMEHCVIAHLLSNGHDHKDCGRPCERHAVSLRDRKGIDLPVEADIGCRNTVFHGVAQSAAEHWTLLNNAAVRRYRIELVRESAGDTQAIVSAYRELMDNQSSPGELRRKLDARGLRTVRGSLRVIG